MPAPDVINIMSDTVTVPTPSMRHAMATCEVGDDVFRSDPTVNKLQEMTAEIVGAEASLWLPTGTMANQVAIAVHTHPGQDVIAGSWSHIVNYELGGIAWNSLCQLNMVSDEGGWITADRIKDAIRHQSDHTPGTGLVCLENTHNRRGGRVMPLDELKKCADVAHEDKIPVHLDGARIWNASRASGVKVSEYYSKVDSMMFCLSKGLASPAGSMLCGKKDFIESAHRMRKRFGGGLRQAGVLAACGILSLTEMVERLDEDHRNAKALARAINESGTLVIDESTVETNICILDLPEKYGIDAFKFADIAEKNGLLVTYMGSKLIRLVTHKDFDGAWIPDVVERIRKSLDR